MCTISAAFTNAGNGEWGKKMHEDLIDGVNWAVSEGVADRQRIGIMGSSYGGYAALVGLSFTPEVFACGVDIVGPSNLVTLLQSIPEYWKPFLARMIKLVGGDPNTLEGQEFLRTRSPLFKASLIRKPLLIAQGVNDPRVNIRESNQIVAEMKKKGLPVTYIVFPDEGHGLSREENRKAFTGVWEHFLSGCLGGRAQPLAPVEGTSMTILDYGNLTDALSSIT